MTNLNMIFHVAVSVHRLVKIWNSPQFPAEFRNGQLFPIEVANSLLSIFSLISTLWVVHGLLLGKLELILLLLSK